MSQDQKPARVRMQAGSTGAPDAAGGNMFVAPDSAAGPAAVEIKRKGGKRGGLLPALLFLVGCIGGGIAVARLGPL